MTDKEFTEQRTWKPQITRALQETPSALVIGGMGGSALSGDALRYLVPERNIIVHRDYGLPSTAPGGALYVAVSYSGTTAETVSFASEALRLNLPLAVVSSGGTLAALAKREELPYVPIPAGYAPRNALLYMTRALLALTGEENALKDLAAVELDATMLAQETKQDAEFVGDGVPLMYASGKNELIARIGAIAMNETARQPAFWNVFPELNHNEMQSFDSDMPSVLSRTFRFILIRDEDDDERIRRRMDVFADLMEERGRLVRAFDCSLARPTALTAMWLRFLSGARLLAQARGIDPDAQPLVDEFKKHL